MAKPPKIYTNPDIPHVDIPNTDLITLLFDSEHGVAEPDTVVHIDAANPDNKLTKKTLISAFQRIAHGLRTHYGVGANGSSKDVVTVMSYGQVMVPALYFGVVAAGGIYSAASPSSTVSELARQVTIGKSNLVVCGSEHIDVVRAAAKQCNLPLSRVLIMESQPSHSLTSLEGNINAISDTEIPWPRITDPQELKKSCITLLWSSGTTGLPKGVALSHLNLVAETILLAVQPRMWAAAEMEKGTYEPMEYRTLAHLPISHIAGLFGYLVMPIFNAGTVYWMRKYHWPDLLKYAKQYKITAFYTVPSIYLRISKSPEVTDHFAYVQAANTGAAPMDGKLQKASNSKLGDGSNTFIGQTWGLSETTGAVTAMPKGDVDDTGSIARILPNVELRMVDENLEDVEPGQEGELLIRSPLVMNGYFNNEEATRDAFHDFNDDGKGKWFCSGDIGVIRDGKFYIVDRKKELLKYKGLQIAPAEIENLLFMHPAVAEAAVVGVPAPDDPGTDWPRAYVVLSPGAISSSSNSVASPSQQTTPAAAAYAIEATSQHGLGTDKSKQDTVAQADNAAKFPLSSSLKSKSGQQTTPEAASYSIDAKAQNNLATDSSKQDSVAQVGNAEKVPSSASNANWQREQTTAESAAYGIGGLSSKTTPTDTSKQDTLAQKSNADELPSSFSSPSSVPNDPSKQDTIAQKSNVDKLSLSDSSPGNEEALKKELQDYVAKRLAAHKQLRGGVVFVDEIPKNSIGKFLRRELRERAKKEIAGQRSKL